LAAVENSVGFLVSWILVPCARARIGIVEREARLVSAEKPAVTSRQLTSEQHAKLAQAFANPDPGLSPEEAQRWQRFVRYHTALSRAALKRELLKANPNWQSPAPDASDGQLAFAGF
jgi:hypothetical protein